MSNETTEVAEPSAKRAWTDETWAFLVLRLWLAARALATGLTKFGGTNEAGEKTYGFQYYSAIPDAMKEAFAAQPLLPDFLTKPFYAVLGYALIGLGLMLLVGLGTRISLVLMGVLYTALTFGLILLGADDGISWLAVHIILVALALAYAKHNRLAILNKW